MASRGPAGDVPAVTFDLWHTLVFLEPASEDRYLESLTRTASEALARCPRRPDAPDLGPEELGTIFDHALRRAVDAAAAGRTVTPVEQFEEAAREAGREPRASEYIDRLERLIRSTRFLPAPGALEVLRELAGDGYRLAVISNTVAEPGRLFRAMLRELGFEPYLRATIFSDEQPWTKPSPEIFRAALRAIGEVPERSVHVGDGWSDLEGAKRSQFRAGILFTGLREYGARYRSLNFAPDWDRLAAAYRVERLEQVPELVRSILPLPRPP